MLKRFFLFLILGLFLFLSIGCQSLTSKIPFELKSQKEKEIAALKANYEEKIKSISENIDNQKDKIIQNQDSQMQAGANSFYGQSVVSKTIKTPSRADLIIGNFTQEGWAALGNRMPDTETMLKINAQIEKDLDETKTSLADLQKEHNQAIIENGKLADDTKDLKSKLVDLQKEKYSEQQSYVDTLNKKTSELQAANNKILAFEQEKADNAAARHAMLMKITFILGAIALACIAGVIWSPVFKKQIGIFGSICGFLSIGIWYIQPWMVILTFFLILGIIIFTFVMEHSHTDTLSDSLVLALQDVKESNKSLAWDDISKIVKDRLSTYKQKNGQITTVENNKLENLIDKKLMDYDRK